VAGLYLSVCDIRVFGGGREAYKSRIGAYAYVSKRSPFEESKTNVNSVSDSLSTYWRYRY